ncbi:MAG TPA: lysylphosphatidylglycerol synthase transmembrane domain-containing protein [Polyangiaceae bacterium]|nr:lysylphosphatidylglycerol synthase transmembrane domain-containing protein [Polyangiaceae bacterium]
MAVQGARGLRPRLARLRLLRLPLQLAVSVGLLVALWHVSGGRALAERLARCDPAWAAAALPFATASLVAGALRWRYTARRLGQRLGVRRAVREFYLACFLSQVLPGGVSGDVVRVWRQSRRSLRRATGAEVAPDSELPEVVPTSQRAGAGVGSALRAVVIERVASQLVMTLSVLGSMALWPWVPGAYAAMRVWGPIAGALGLTGLLLAALALFARRRERGRAAAGGVERFLADARRALWSRQGLPAQLGLGLLVVGNCLAMFYCAARAVNAPLSVFPLLALVPPALFAMSVPISIGGWGLREASAVALWAMAGLPETEAMASSVLYGALTLLSTLPGALVLATEP